MKTLCDYCRRPAELVTGKEIYGNRRPDLWRLRFWRCVSCKAWVGCHKNGSGTIPLGRLANAELRSAKTAAHASFDRVWKHGKMRRGEAYLWLASALGVSPWSCHIGMFDVAMCRRVVEVCKNKEQD